MPRLAIEALPASPVHSGPSPSPPLLGKHASCSPFPTWLRGWDCPALLRPLMGVGPRSWGHWAGLSPLPPKARAHTGGSPPHTGSPGPGTLQGTVYSQQVRACALSHGRCGRGWNRPRDPESRPRNCQATLTIPCRRLAQPERAPGVRLGRPPPGPSLAFCPDR